MALDRRPRRRWSIDGAALGERLAAKLGPSPERRRSGVGVRFQIRTQALPRTRRVRRQQRRAHRVANRLGSVGRPVGPVGSEAGRIESIRMEPQQYGHLLGDMFRHARPADLAGSAKNRAPVVAIGGA